MHAAIASIDVVTPKIPSTTLNATNPLIAVRQPSRIVMILDEDDLEEIVIVSSRSARQIPDVHAAPDRTVCSFTHEQRAIPRDCNTVRATPDLGVGDHKTGHEILILAGWL